MITFNSKDLVQKFLEELPERSQDVLKKRYGLVDSKDKKTLEAIGKRYNITRERVRQIENHSLKNIAKSCAFKDSENYFKELLEAVDYLGGVLAEKELLKAFSEDPIEQNRLHFLFVIGEPFYKEKANTEFTDRWYVDKKLAEEVLTLLKKIHSTFDGDMLLNEEELLNLVRKEAKRIKARKVIEDEQLKKWLSISKMIDRNPFGEWGLVTSQNIKIRGIRSYAYLVVRQNGSPMHFKEVAKKIEESFGKKVHTATCHNELIKDERFVLVGRGMYALAEWGYSQGVVKDVVLNILKEAERMTKEEIIDRVLKERYVKENTVLVNLQNADFFKKNEDGTYSLI